MATDETKLEVEVGESWPEGLEVHIERRATSSKQEDPRNTVALGTAIFLGILLAAFAVYGMFASEEMLEKVFGLVEYGLVSLWGFVFGHLTKSK